MTATVSTLPVWKKGATTAEWLQELSAMALERPERWAKVVVILGEANTEGAIVNVRYYGNEALKTNSEILGLMEEGKLHLWDYMRGRV
jgi:hypothetical protein